MKRKPREPSPALSGQLTNDGCRQTARASRREGGLFRPVILGPSRKLLLEQQHWSSDPLSLARMNVTYAKTRSS